MVAWEALDALSHELELCKINADTRVITLVDEELTPDYAALLRAAVARTGAEALEVRPVRTSENADNSLLLMLADQVDVVIASSGQHGDAVRAAGCKTLVIETSVAPNKFPPCLLYTSPSPRDATLSRMPSSA